MTFPRTVTCPCCFAVSAHADDIRNGYCARCHWWTSAPEMAPYHFALPCEHRAQGIMVPRLGEWHRETNWIIREDPPLPFALAFPRMVDLGDQWLPTMPGTILEIAGHLRGRRLPWWSRLANRIIRLLKRPPR